MVHPHARGADPIPGGPLVGAAGFIPTPVGQMRTRMLSRPLTRVHPHARGADVERARRLVVRSGSSPRPWGRLGAVAAPRRRRRFIPTPVGQMQVRHKRDPGRCGSSPRPWGRSPERGEVVRQRRFIPTPVGQMRAMCGASAVQPVHPHARGADEDGKLDLSYHTGSSPRPWGRSLPPRRGPGLRRFIPTPVGQMRPRPA